MAKVFIMDDYVKYTLKKEKISYLKVEDGKIVDENNKYVQLKGISSHGYQWFSNLLTENNFKYLITKFDINTFRIAVYVNDELDFNNMKEDLYNTIDTLTKLNLYVIVDWHILENGNPMVYKEKAKIFFDEISKKYKDSPNIIYEICNEPNGSYVTWNEIIRPYAEEIIPVIRNNSPKSIIVVGTPSYSKNIEKAAENPLNFENIVYSVHFYAGSDGDYLRINIKNAKDKKIAILVTEWGTTNETGDGDVYEENSKKWIDFLDENNIGYINWSFCNKQEGSALLLPEYNSEEEPKNLDKFLTESAKIVEKLYTKNN